MGLLWTIGWVSRSLRCLNHVCLDHRIFRIIPQIHQLSWILVEVVELSLSTFICLTALVEDALDPVGEHCVHDDRRVWCVALVLGEGVFTTLAVTLLVTDGHWSAIHPLWHVDPSDLAESR